MRLNKFIANCGYCSRRAADKLIKAGKVNINGKTIKKLGTKIDPLNDNVTIGKRIVSTSNQKIYYKLYKPKGYISTTKDPYAKKIVTDLIDETQRLFLVGRLDKDSEGLMILTNDGDLAYTLTHPKNKHKKVYLVTIRHKNNISRSSLKKILDIFKNGIKIDSKFAQFVKAKITKIYKNTAVLKITLQQGIKRQIREMFAVYNYSVVDLKRIKIAKLKLGNLQPKEYLKIDKKDIL